MKRLNILFYLGDSILLRSLFSNANFLGPLTAVERRSTVNRINAVIVWSRRERMGKIATKNCTKFTSKSNSNILFISFYYLNCFMNVGCVREVTRTRSIRHFSIKSTFQPVHWPSEWWNKRRDRKRDVNEKWKLAIFILRLLFSSTDVGDNVFTFEKSTQTYGFNNNCWTSEVETVKKKTVNDISVN